MPPVPIEPTPVTIPRSEEGRDLLDAPDLPPEAIAWAKEFAQYPLGKDGTLPPQRAARAAASGSRLAQEVGKAFAHVTLAFLELQAGGWPRDTLD
jgi:hypothetical protein